MKKISVSKFRKRWFELVEAVDRTREPLVITRNGKPIAKVVPTKRLKGDIFGLLAGKFQIVGNIESPTELPEAWNVLR